MKRFLVFLLVISVMLLPGCGSSKSEDTRTVLTLDGGGHALLSDAVRLFNASNEDYRVVISEQDPDIVADRSAYDSAALVDIISYVDADMGRGDILPFLLDGLMEGEALYSLPISWGTVSLGCSKALLDGRTTLTAEEALELLEAMDEGALLFPSWISCGGAPNELAAYLPRYGEEADGYAGESTLLDRVIIYSSAQLAAMLTEPDALWDTGCPGLGPAAGCISLSILKSCEDVEGAWEFLSFAYGPEARPALSASGEYELPASLSFLEAQLSEFEGVDGDALELAREYVGGLSLDA
ncbi:MAG TPA: extracellular solute-binding protein [Candidatus Scatomorpha merdavium]|nr:extracellular solute-binding protein [Candidatus Scatomorpha merdavium]